MDNFGVLSILPVVVAVILAVTLRKVVVSLVSAIFIAALIVNHFNPVDTVVYAARNLFFSEAVDKDHLTIIVFTLFVGAMVGILIKAGATREFIFALGKVIRGKKSTQLLAWFSGMLVFFDDYTNCLVVGNTMRPLADKHKVSREKLAYIVDSTAAPVTTVAIISTWVAFQVSLIDKALASSNMNLNAYNFFIDSIFYNFYAWLAILFVGALIMSGREFGPMLKAETAANLKVAETEGQTGARKANMLIVSLFVLPILILVGVCLGDLWWTGRQGLPENAAFFEIIGNANSYAAMLKASGAALLVTILMTLLTGQLMLREVGVGIWNGVQELGGAIVVLICAWALAAGINDLGAAKFLTEIMQGNVSPTWLPTAIFIVASAISFSTGTSFGTMAILVPLVLPIAFSITTDTSIHLASAASILGGAVFGDHCSPISDTTILSSTGSGCNLVEHFRTQIPYALFVGVATIVFGTIPTGFGFPAWASLVLGSIALIIGIRLFGKLPITQETSSTTSCEHTHIDKKFSENPALPLA